MSTNPFEDRQSMYRVLVNDAGHRSLWPAFARVPAGWRVMHEEDSRDACLRYIAADWTDLKAKTL